ncbi:hypothetical protein LguiB_010434 [Lonicera macranthoides]
MATVPSLSSASASAADSVVGEYEVFLSFRDADTRCGFTGYLYNDLVGAGVCTFRDDNDLRVGEEIGPELLKAINESKISIPIFSKRYTNSEWCLRELAHMVACKANRGQMIYPIFYDVDPSCVQHQRGSYKKAFCNHRKSVDEETVKQWVEALEIVGELKGLELKKETNILSLTLYITEVQGLGGLESLEHLDMTGLEHIKRLSDLSKLRWLRKLEISSCRKLIEIQGLHGLESIELLDMSWCISITSILGYFRTCVEHFIRVASATRSFISN